MHETYAIVLQAVSQGLWIGFCTAALIGPVNFMAVRRGILGGFPQTFLVGSGAALVDAACAYAVFAGLLRTGFAGMWKVVLWGIGAFLVLYLVYAVLVDLRENPEALPTVKAKTQVLVLERPFVLGLLIAGGNPYTLIYWTGVVAALQFSGEVSLTGRAATSFFSAVLVSELAWFTLLGLAVHHSRNLFNRRVLSRVSMACGALLLAYGAFMVVKIVLNLARTGGAPAIAS